MNKHGLCAWKSRRGSKPKTMTIPKNHLDFAKDNLARTLLQKMMPRMEMKLKMKMRDDNVGWGWCLKHAFNISRVT